MSATEGACPTGCRARTEKRVRHTLIFDGSGELGGHAPSVGRVTPNAVRAIHVLHKHGIDTAVARPPVPPIHPEKTRVGRVEETRVDPLVHGLEDRDVSDSGRWAKVAPLHAGTYDARDVVVSVVNAKKSRPPSCIPTDQVLELELLRLTCGGETRQMLATQATS